MKKKILLATAMLAISAGVANADVVTIDTIVDNWQNAVGGGGTVSYNNQLNPNADTVSWGGNLGNGQSSYVWDSNNTAFNVTTGTNFSLGQFTHNNKPIAAGTSITSVDLAFSVGTFEAPASLSATFQFSHDETPNSGTCTYPSVTPCADRVTITNAFFNAPIVDNGGTNYFFTLLGFSIDGGNTISNQFVTQEGVANNAQLYAIITTAPVPDGGATLALLGGALMGLGMLRRKFRA